MGILDPTRTVLKDGEPITEPAWEPIFLEKIDGVFLVTGESYKSVQSRVTLISDILGTSVALLSEVPGQVRPKEGPGGIKLRGKEHFGWQDGISEPKIPKFHPAPTPKEAPVDLGIILLRKNKAGVVRHPIKPDGFFNVLDEPSWAENGSYLTFRKLQQKGMPSPRLPHPSLTFII